MNCRECDKFYSCPEYSTEEDDICNNFCYDEELGEKHGLGR